MANKQNLTESGANEKEKAEEGLPDIAKGTNKDKFSQRLGVGVLVVGMLFIFYTYFIPHSNTKKEIAATAAEDYSVIPANKGSSTGDAVLQKSATEKTNAPTQEQLNAMLATQRALQERLAAPLMVVAGQSNKGTANAAAASATASDDPNMQFMKQVSAQSTDTVKATVIGPLNYLIAEGSLIHGVLETAVNSDLPGYLRAIVSKPIYSEDGSQVLIPPGSRLIGQYKSGMMQGQARVFVVWTRIIIPGGISIDVGSPGTDSLGVAGMGADSIDRHFFERFGTAVLLSVLGAGAANVGVNSNDQYNAAQAYRSAVANSLSESASQSIRQNGMIPPTIHIDQGKPIIVFVAHDLNFQSAMQVGKSKTNVF